MRKSKYSEHQIIAILKAGPLTSASSAGFRLPVHAGA